jgi:hypothetical protein
MPARERVLELRDAGMTFDAIGRAAGVAPSSVWRALSAGHLRATTANAILAVPVPP